jgi:hypothetical protein
MEVVAHRTSNPVPLEDDIEALNVVEQAKNCSESSPTPRIATLVSLKYLATKTQYTVTFNLFEEIKIHVYKNMMVDGRAVSALGVRSRRLSTGLNGQS